MTGMDCAHCQDALLDLTGGALPPDVERTAREHLRDCDRCRGDLARIEAGLAFARELPDEAPSPALASHVLAYAKARANGARVAQPVGASVPPRRRFQALTDFLATLALQHQVAMAAVFLVVVAISVWSVPKLRPWPEVAGGAVVNPDPSGEAAPSAQLAPAEPLDLKVDRLRGRIRTAEEVEEAAAKRAAAPAAVPSSIVTGPVAPAAPEPSPWPGAGDLDDEYALAERAQMGAEAARTAPAKAADTKGRVDPDETIAMRPRRTAAGAPDEGARAADDLLDGALLGASGSGRASASAPTAPTASVAPEARVGESASTLLASARTTKSANGCSAALPRFREVATRFPRTREAGEALLESARCEVELGRSAAAQQSLQGAAAIPSSAVRARALLDELRRTAAGR